MSEYTEWSHKDEWRKRGSDFLVTVTRHNTINNSNKWAVYAYIYRSHRLFTTFNGNNIYQPATDVLPLHHSPSFLEYHRDDEGICSVQVGADYVHTHDDRFMRYKNKPEAYEVFNDADILFNFLKKAGETKCQK